jgi:hypothetical protein
MQTSHSLSDINSIFNERQVGLAETVSKRVKGKIA